MLFINKHLEDRTNILNQFKGFFKFFSLIILIAEFSFCFTLITYDCSTGLVIYLVTWMGIILCIPMCFVYLLICKHPQIYELENSQNNNINMQSLEDFRNQIHSISKAIKDKPEEMTEQEESLINKIEGILDWPQFKLDSDDG